MPDQTSSPLVSRVICPHCWHHFAPHDVLWVAAHTELIGDPKLGQDAAQRFLPSRFTVQGDAIDARGFPCRSLACPRCHLVIPRPFLEMKPLFFSVLGAPFSGKSFFLASMMWSLRKDLLQKFQLNFADADSSFNIRLTEYEETLFLKTDPEKLTPLQHFIEKTQADDGRLLNRVQYGSQAVEYPQPFVFSMQPNDQHPQFSKRAKLARILCIYDNAGESFQPGMDTVRRPVTQHMASSKVLFFVFDPMQDPRFQSALGSARPRKSVDVNRMNRQEHLLNEAAVRIRRYGNLSLKEKHKAPLVVICSKFDAWSTLLGDVDRRPPWRSTPSSAIHAVEAVLVQSVSDRVRALLSELCPEIVAAAEGLSQDVVYIPTSATGWNTQIDPATGDFSIRPKDIDPFWITVPFIYAMARWVPGLVPTFSPRGPSKTTSDGSGEIRSGFEGSAEEKMA
jgi:hypothetical protein